MLASVVNMEVTVSPSALECTADVAVAATTAATAAKSPPPTAAAVALYGVGEPGAASSSKLTRHTTSLE